MSLSCGLNVCVPVRLDSSGHFLVVTVCIILQDVCKMMVCLCILFLVGLVGFGC